MSAPRPAVLRLVFAGLVAASLSACTAEHEVSMSEFREIDSDDHVFRVDGEPFTGDVVVREGERLRARVEVDDGKPDGIVELFHENGEPALRGEVYWDEDEEESVRDGETIRWNEEGVMVSRQEWDEGEQGLAETWCGNGKPETVEEFEDGKRTSATEWDCETGNPIAESRFDENGELSGEQKQWAPDGTLISLRRYEAGQLEGLQEGWHANGKPLSRATFAAGEPVGEVEAWYEDGTVAERGTFDSEGNKTGFWLEQVGSWSSGTWESFGEQGQAPDRRHYGPDGFIDPGLAGPFVSALGDGTRPEPDKVAFYLEDGEVAATDALPANYNGYAVSGPFEFPLSRWTYPVVVADGSVLPTLLAHGADINKADSQGTTRLMRCAGHFNGDTRPGGRGCAFEDLAGLLGKGAKAGVVDASGRNALHYLVDDTSREDRTMWGRPHAESAKARKDALEALVKGGADVDARDREGWTPLVLALAERRADLALALLEQGADATEGSPDGTKPIHWVFLESPDRYAIKEDAFTETMLRELVARGANVNAPMAWNGDQVTLRDLAMRHGLVGVAKQLDGLAAP